jgi:anthranilate phosphoribosyltransferase
MDGYDEISLTQDSKIITKSGENIYSAEDLGFKTVEAENIQAGTTIEETAKIFRDILEGKGTDSQNAVVLVNAAVALFHTNKFGTYEDCLALAKDSLFERKALNCLRLLVDG